MRQSTTGQAATLWSTKAAKQVAGYYDKNEDGFTSQTARPLDRHSDYLPIRDIKNRTDIHGYELGKEHNS